jgi:tRNA A37 methylthiotransferase MiaB
VWLSSEDTGAYGRDIGTNLPALLRSCLEVLPADGRTMLRLGMTNPPFILEHLEEIAEVRGSRGGGGCWHPPGSLSSFTGTQPL